MDFLEKDLEDIIYNASNEQLDKRGLRVRGKRFRQLRIGNYVYFQDTLLKFDFESGWNFDYIKPIPLTEEWLFKLGFVEGSYLYKNYKVKAGDYWNSVKFYEGEWCYNNDDSDAGCYFLTTIKYVHELQNLYFAINKTEL